MRGDLEKARQFGLDFLRAAEREPTPGLMLAGNFLLGCSLFHLGQLEASLDHMTAAIRAHSGPAGIRAGAVRRAGPRRLLPLLSRPSRVAPRRAEIMRMRHAAEAIAAARRMRHPFSEAIALDYATMLHVFRGESRAALERGREAVELCSTPRLHLLPGDGECPDGLGGSRGGRCGRGPGATSRGAGGMRGLGAELRLPYYFALLAETLGRAGLVGEALASLSTGFAFASKNGEEWAVAELYRVQGDLLAARGKARTGARQLPAGHRGSAAVGFAGVRTKIVDSCRRNGRKPPLQNAPRTPRLAK